MIVYVGSFDSPIHIVNSSATSKYYGMSWYTISLKNFEERNFRYIAVGGPMTTSLDNYGDVYYYLFGGQSPNNVRYMTVINASQIAKPIINDQHFIIPLPPNTYIKMTPIVKGNKLYFKIETTRNYLGLLVFLICPIITLIFYILYVLYFLVIETQKKAVQTSLRDVLGLTLMGIYIILLVPLAFSSVFMAFILTVFYPFMLAGGTSN